MATTLHLYRDTGHVAASSSVFSPTVTAPTYTRSSFSTLTPPQSPPQKYAPAAPLPPSTDKLITAASPPEPSLAARLHRRKKGYRLPSAPAQHGSDVTSDPLRAARIAWRLQEEYAEQVRVEEEQLRRGSPHQERGRPAVARGKQRRKEVRNRWQGFWLWVSLRWYRFTRSVRNLFTK
jgi:hypothetical protein